MKDETIITQSGFAKDGEPVFTVTIVRDGRKVEERKVPIYEIDFALGRLQRRLEVKA